jgi:hypothetical protein
VVITFGKGDQLMKTDAFEDELRQALGGRAAEVPAAAVDRLRQRNYRPRGHSRVTLAGAGLVVAALAASAGAYLAGAPAGSGHVPAGDGHVPAGVAEAAKTTVRLDGYTFSLPPGFKTGHAQCTAPEFAIPVQQSKQFEAGAVAHDACVQVVLTTLALNHPSAAVPIPVGRYHGYLLRQPQAHRIILFTDISSPGNPRALVVAARNLSESQVFNMVGRALGLKLCPPGGPGTAAQRKLCLT